MFTVSCYAFHPFILKFVKIWRYVQLISDVLYCLLAMLCCQCIDMLPLSSSSSGVSKIATYTFKQQIPASASVEPLKASEEPQHPEHLVIDLPPQTEDMAKETKCPEYRIPVEMDQEAQDTTINPDHKKIDLLASLDRGEDSQEKNNIPSVHSMKKSNENVIPEPLAIELHQ